MEIELTAILNLKPETTKQLHARIPEGVYKKLKVKCVSEDTSIQKYLVQLIAQSLGEYPTEEKIVLIVDDEAILRESLGEYLKDTYQVVGRDG